MFIIKSVKRGLLHYVVELLLVYKPVLVLVELVDHRLDLLVAKILAKFPRDPFQIFKRYFALHWLN